VSNRDDLPASEIRRFVITRMNLRQHLKEICPQSSRASSFLKAAEGLKAETSKKKWAKGPTLETRTAIADGAMVIQI
jgi:hypothetical protein